MIVAVYLTLNLGSVSLRISPRRIYAVEQKIGKKQAIGCPQLEAYVEEVT